MRRVDPTDGGGDPFPDPTPAEPRDAVDISIAIDQPAAGSTLTGHSDGVTVAVTGSTSINSGAGSIDAVEVHLGDGAWEAASADGPGFARWSFAKVVTTSGSLAVSARARHSSGLVEATEVGGVSTVITPDPPAADTIPPTVAITSPLSTIPLVADASNAASVAILGTAGDAGGSGLAGVHVLVDGVEMPVENVSGDWSQWSAQVSLAGLGEHLVSARAVDGAGLSMEAALPLQVVAVLPRRPVVERLMLVEKLRLSTHLGAYGLGRTIKTLSLLPGESTTISLKTYKRSSETSSEASSMLDSSTTESQQEFESTLSREQSAKQTSDQSFKWNVSASASATWGFGSASITGGASGGSNAAREELAKNVSSSVSKCAAKAASKRDLEIKSSREDKVESGDETASETKVTNINVSRTLNFVFRQMNQEFISLLCLADVRVAYVRLDDVDGSLFGLSTTGATGPFVLTAGAESTAPLPSDAGAGDIQAALAALGSAGGSAEVTQVGPGAFTVELERPDVALSAASATPPAASGVDIIRLGLRASYQEVTLPQLGPLLARVLKDEAIPKVRNAILDVLANVFDYDDEPHAMVEERVLAGPDGTPLPNGRYLRVPKNRTTSYVDEATGTKITVPGVILAAMRNVMPTDGVFCDAVLGHGAALDAYSQGLQDEAVRSKQLANEREQAGIDRERLGIGLVQSGNAAGATVFQAVFPAEEPDQVALATLPLQAETNGHP